MQRFSLSWLGIWLLLAGLAGAEDQAQPAAPALPPRERFHLYLLIGQSNMAGRGQLDEETAISSARVLKFTPENTWAPGTEPIHPAKRSGKGAGLAASFARSMADADPQVTIGLIPCAVGGTPLARWMKGGDLYTQAVARTRTALADGTLRGILWHQGERDAFEEETARSYGDRLAGMVADLRADLGAGEVPLVVGQLGEFLPNPTHPGKYAFSKLVNEQLTALPGRVPSAAVAESAGLTARGDDLHFDTPSLRTFGVRYAAAMQRLQNSQSSDR